MKKTMLLIAALILSFVLGFAFSKLTVVTAGSDAKTGRVTGIGGVFFKCKDPAKMNAWYKTHLGLNTNAYGAVFEWRQATDSSRKGFTTWSPFKESTRYFAPSTASFMINYRVNNITALVAQLKKDGVAIVDTIATYDYGKFVHLLDAEGNKVELWEPNDKAYEKLGLQMGATTTK